MFGNAGALFMTAMTWFDHTNGSIWSQPWGRSIIGDYKNIQLQLLPSQITTWGSWKAEHPYTLAMINDVENLAPNRRQGFTENFVIGLLLNEKSIALYYRDVAQAGVINTDIDGIPVMVWAANDNFHAYVRQVGERVLTFEWEDGVLQDVETGSIWDVTRGFAIEGELAGEALQAVPGSSSFDWAWRDFYPEAIFYSP